MLILESNRAYAYNLYVDCGVLRDIRGLALGKRRFERYIYSLLSAQKPRPIFLSWKL
jgi:hypothetical protein